MALTGIKPPDEEFERYFKALSTEIYTMVIDAEYQAQGYEVASWRWIQYINSQDAQKV